jgi:hypothetical protein
MTLVDDYMAVGGAQHGRLSARLVRLPHDVLAELCATLCCERRESCAAADALLAVHDPLPAWVTSEVLLSPDLAPNLMAPLDLEHGTAACVCKAWRVAWIATDEGRRGLRAPMKLFPPDFELMNDPRIIASQDGERLCIAADNCRRLVDRRMATLHDLHPFGMTPPGSVRAVSDDSMYAVLPRDDGYGTRLCRIEFDGTTSSVVASFAPPQGANLSGVTLAPNNLALAASSNHRIVALDARTLEERFRFQMPPETELGTRIGDLTVVADEVFCCDFKNRSLHVFSLAGEYLRAIRGPWREPRSVTQHKGRLFVCEYAGSGEEPWGWEYGLDGGVLLDEANWSAEKKAAGKRIFVVTPQGETLQVFDQFPTPIQEVDSMTVMGNRLVVCCENQGEDETGTAYELKGM